jgi:aminoglycoside phosphotransferase (APT) family kinase protein
MPDAGAVDLPPWSQGTAQLPAPLARVVATALGGEGRVRAVEARRSPFSGVSPADTVTVELEHGETIRLWVKRLSVDGDGHPDKTVPDREPRVYAALLADTGLPVPHCYGCARDPSTGERELVLEQIRDWDLRYHGVETWEVAFRALGRLHHRFMTRADDLRRATFLLRLDAGYVQRWRDRAIDALARSEPVLGRRLEARGDKYEHVAALIDRQPPTLVHNDLAPKNVIADTSHDPPRICFVDWETAGVGCGALDVVHLLHGLAPSAAQRLIEAYGREAEHLLPGGGERARLLAACRAHKTVFRLAHPPLWRRRRRLAHEWLDELEQDLRVL